VLLTLLNRLRPLAGDAAGHRRARPVAWLGGFEASGGKVVGALPEQVIALALPATDWRQITDLLPAAFVLALVSFLEAMSSCKIAAARTGQRWDGNQELIGQGLAKLTAAVCQAYPVSGSFGRSAFLLGPARTGLASVVGALMVLAALLAIPGLIAHIPRPLLAAVILVTVAKLLSIAPLREAWRSSRDDGLAGTVSFVATLAFAPHIEIGILSGLLLSLALLIYRSMRPRVAVLGRHPDGTWRDARRFGLPAAHPGLAILRFDGPLHFVNAATFEDAVLAVERDHPQLKVLLISSAGINDIDASGIDTLRRSAASWPRAGGGWPAAASRSRSSTCWSAPACGPSSAPTPPTAPRTTPCSTCCPARRRAATASAAAGWSGRRALLTWIVVPAVARQILLHQAFSFQNNYCKGASMTPTSVRDIRNLSLLGQSGSGKTTLLERLLLPPAPSAPRLGREGRHRQRLRPPGKSLRPLPQQQPRPPRMGRHWVNVLDTPGLPDFLGRALATLPAVETAVVVVNAAAGVETVTRKVMDAAAEKCRMIVVNRIDAPGVDFAALLERLAPPSARNACRSTCPPPAASASSTASSRPTTTPCRPSPACARPTTRSSTRWSRWTKT
jgi:hypothetical protein